MGLAEDLYGEKYGLGCKHGATERHEVCRELLNNLEDRGLQFSEEILFVIDAGKDLLKALREKIG